MARQGQDGGQGTGAGSVRTAAIDDEARLLELYGRLSPEHRRGLLEHAERLAASVPSGVEATRAVDRPAQESVVQAIRRLTRAYPGLERGKLMGVTARCLAAHMIDGREAAVVIAELEAIFAREHGRSAAGTPEHPERARQVRARRDEA